MEYDDVFKHGHYLKSIQLYGKDVTTMIIDAKVEVIKDDSRPDSTEEGLVIYVHGQKPFICNQTNYKRISLIAGSANTDTWKGRVITLFAERGKWFGVEQTAIRVRSQPEKIDLFLEEATSLEDLRERTRLLGNRANLKLATEIANKWKE